MTISPTFPVLYYTPQPIVHFQLALNYAFSGPAEKTNRPFPSCDFCTYTRAISSSINEAAAAALRVRVLRLHQLLNQKEVRKFRSALD